MVFCIVRIALCPRPANLCCPSRDQLTLHCLPGPFAYSVLSCVATVSFQVSIKPSTRQRFYAVWREERDPAPRLERVCGQQQQQQQRNSSSSSLLLCLVGSQPVMSAILGWTARCSAIFLLPPHSESQFQRVCRQWPQQCGCLPPMCPSMS